MHRPPRVRPWCRLLVSGLLLGVAACSSPPDVPIGPDGKPDPVLAEGRDVYADECSSCHGTSGGGGRGPSLRDIAEEYPDLEDQIEVIVNGKGGEMPPFGGELSDEQILAVARYTREVLGG